VIALNPRCSACDNFPIREKAWRPIIRSDRERVVARHLHEREVMFRRNCFQLSKDFGGLADPSSPDIKGSSEWASGGLLWESEGGDDILKRRAYTIEEAVEFVGVQRSRCVI